MLPKLFATAFPPVYRLLAINLVALVCATEVSDFYARSFFLISLLVTFAGTAVSSQSYVVSRVVSLARRVGLTAILLLIFAPLFRPLWPEGINSYVIVVVAAFGASLFEVLRADLAVKGRFAALVVQGVAASLSLFLIVPILKDSPWLLCVLISWVLPISAILMPGNSIVGEDRVTCVVVKDVASYSLSSGVSTGLSFALPVLIAGDLGSGAPTELAQIMTVTSMFLLYPRFLSTGFMVDLQRCQTREMVDRYEKRNSSYLFAVVGVYLAVSILVLPELQRYALFAIATVATQMALPFSNVHSVLARGHDLLSVNLRALAVLVALIAGAYMLFDPGMYRAQCVMAVYLAYVILRNYLTKKSCLRLLSARPVACQVE